MNFEAIIEKRKSRLGLRIFSHVLFWLITFSSTYFLIKFSFNPYRNSPFVYLTPLKNILGLILFFYPFMYFIITRFLKKKNWLTLIFAFLILTLLHVVFEAISEKLIFEYCSACLTMALEHNPAYVGVIQKNILHNILFKGSNFQLFLQLFSSLILPIAIKISIEFYHFYFKNLQLEKENVHLELNFLKAQVNPHFLFNTLNNIYGLVMHKKMDKSIDAISRLSEVLRYTLDYADNNKIELSKEIELINNYIELEKLRLNETVVNVKINTDDKSAILPPLLFMPFLENAFKYNVDQKGNRIDINLNIKEDVVTFEVKNIYDEGRSKEVVSGIGLKNLEKRLRLYFQDDYIYEVIKENSIYLARLKFELV